MSETDHCDERRQLVPVRGELRRAGWCRVTHGVHRPVVPIASLHDDIRAWQLVLPPSGAFTSLTAAALFGWWLPPLPVDVPVFAAIPRREARLRRAGLRVCRLTRPITAGIDADIRFTAPADTLLAAARDLGVLDLVVLVDAALQLGHCTVDELGAAAARSCWGAPKLRHALRYADGRSESAWETLLRMLHVVCDVPVEPQSQVFDGNGGFIARADLRILGTMRLPEYDGEEHREPRRHTQDLKRERALQRAGYQRYGYTASVVLTQGVTVLRDADEALRRRHDPERIRGWHRLLGESLFTASGTASLPQRWGLPAPGDCGREPRARSA